MDLRNIKASDCQIISQAFQQQGWNKPLSLYQKYVEFQANGQRDIIIAEYDKQIAGYLTILWESGYAAFRKQGIPEINDINVLKKYQRQGIGTALMDEAEKRIKKVSAYSGIGFGLFSDYGPAQILYIKRGYIPDGRGISKDEKTLKYGDKITVDDSIALYLTKKL